MPYLAATFTSLLTSGWFSKTSGSSSSSTGG
jgi:hypothetical protein